MNWKIPLSIPDIGHEEIKIVTSVLKNKWLTMGTVTQKFEGLFARKMNVKYAFAVTNCTAALHLANVVLGIKVGDEVICPALTFVASANATRYTGAKVVFADSISEEDLTIDPKDIEKNITPKTRAIIIVHYAGFPCLMDEISRIAKKYSLKIIEDCAHSPFAWTKLKDGSKKFVGSIGDIGCFSFFSTKNMTTCEGGMITTNNDTLAKKIKLLRSHGMTALTYERFKGHATNYDVVMLGYNYRIDEIRSAMGIAQLKKLDSNNKRRRQIYKMYMSMLSKNSDIIIPFRDRTLNQATPHIMPVIIRKDYSKIKDKLRKAGIQTSKHYDLIPRFTLYRKNNFKSKIKYLKNILTLPMYPSMSRNEIESVARIINE